MDLGSLARGLGMPKSTIHRISRVMRRDRWLASDGALLRLGVRAMALGSRALDEVLLCSFNEVASELVSVHNETICLVIRVGREVVFVAKQETTHEVRLIKEIGSRLPAFAAASGRVLLGELPDRDLRRLLGDGEFQTPTGRRIGGLDELIGDLQRVRRRGYAENDQDTAPGLYCVSCPVRDADGLAVAAITFCVPVGRADLRRRPRLRAALRQAAGEISALVAGATGSGEAQLVSR